MKMNTCLRSLCFTARNRKCTRVRNKLIVSSKLSGEEQCNGFYRAITDEQDEVAKRILCGSVPDTKQTLTYEENTDEARKEAMETLMKKVAEADDCPIIKIAEAGDFPTVKKADDLPAMKRVTETDDFLRLTKVAEADDVPTSFCMGCAINEDDEILVSKPLNKCVNVNSSDLNAATHLAVTKGNSKIIETLLAEKSDVNFRYKGSTLLHTAVFKGDEKTVALLLRHGANVNAKMHDGSTVLFTAAEKGFLQIAEILIDAGANVRANITLANEIDPLKEKFFDYQHHVCKLPGLLSFKFPDDRHYKEGQWTLLHTAAEKGHAQIVALLLSKGVECNSYDNLHRTPLYIAASERHEEVVKLLREHGAEIDPKDEGLQTPLHYFAVGGCLESAETLLKHGANIDAEDFLDQTPLYLAAAVGEGEMVKFLLKNGARRTRKHGRTLLHQAAGFGSVEAACLLLKNGLSSENLDKWGMTALHIAVCRGFEPVVKALLEHGADVDVASRSQGGKSALMLAAEKGDIRCVRALLKFGAKIDLKDHGFYERSALFTAVVRGFFDIVELLLSYGADVELRDKEGMTALLLAVHEATSYWKMSSDREPYLRVIKTLLKFGADINAVDEYLRTPLKMAAFRRKKPAALGIILEYGTADIHIVPETTAYSLFEEVDYDLRQNSPLPWRIEEGEDKEEDCMGTTAEMLMRYIVKMKAANLYVNKETFVTKEFTDQNKLMVFQKECEMEIAKMRRDRIGNSDITFYDILTKNVDEMSHIVRNESVACSLKFLNYKNRFPNYGHILNNQFEKGRLRIIRNELQETGIKFCHFLLNRARPVPYDVTEWLALKYLDKNDLRSLVEHTLNMEFGLNFFRSVTQD